MKARIFSSENINFSANLDCLVDQERKELYAFNKVLYHIPFQIQGDILAVNSVPYANALYSVLTENGLYIVECARLVLLDVKTMQIKESYVLDKQNLATINTVGIKFNNRILQATRIGSTVVIMFNEFKTIYFHDTPKNINNWHLRNSFEFGWALVVNNNVTIKGVEENCDFMDAGLKDFCIKTSILSDFGYRLDDGVLSTCVINKEFIHARLKHILRPTENLALFDKAKEFCMLGLFSNYISKGRFGIVPTGYNSAIKHAIGSTHTTLYMYDEVKGVGTQRFATPGISEGFGDIITHNIYSPFILHQ